MPRTAWALSGLPRAFPLPAVAILTMVGPPRSIPDRTNDAWLAALGTTGPAQAEALDGLRSLLGRGLGDALADRPNVTRADIQGFVHNALLKALDNLTSFRGESRFTTWAQKIASSQRASSQRVSTKPSMN